MLRLKRVDADDGPNDLLLNDARVLGLVEEDGGLDEEAVGALDVAAAQRQLARLLALLEVDHLEVGLGGGLLDQLAGSGGAREGDDAHFHVVGQHGARDDVEYARREAGLVDQLGDARYAQRRLLARLEHDCVAGYQGAGHFMPINMRGPFPCFLSKRWNVSTALSVRGWKLRQGKKHEAKDLQGMIIVSTPYGWRIVIPTKPGVFKEEFPGG